MSNGVLHCHGHIIGEGTDDVVTFHTPLETTEKDVGDQNAKEWGKVDNPAEHRWSLGSPEQ